MRRNIYFHPGYRHTHLLVVEQYTGEQQQQCAYVCPLRVARSPAVAQVDVWQVEKGVQTRKSAVAMAYRYIQIWPGAIAPGQIFAWCYSSKAHHFNQRNISLDCKNKTTLYIGTNIANSLPYDIFHNSTCIANVCKNDMTFSQKKMPFWSYSSTKR